MSKLLIGNMPPLRSQRRVVCELHGAVYPAHRLRSLACLRHQPFPQWHHSQTQRGRANPTRPTRCFCGGVPFSGQTCPSLRRGHASSGF